MFEAEFRTWLDSALSDGVPKEVKAFSFNIFEPALVENVKYGIEIIGAERFDSDDTDWACDEIWEPNQSTLNIPESYSGVYWEECLTKMKRLILESINRDNRTSAVLRSKLAIGVGFVDGDLHIIWAP